jgi:hypothetical protein
MYISENMEGLSPQDCLDIARVLGAGKRHKESLGYLEAGLMKDDSVMGRFLLAGAYAALPEELPEEDRNQIEDLRKALGKEPLYFGAYLSMGNQKRGLIHLLDYKMRGGVPEIEKENAANWFGLSLALKGPGTPVPDAPIWKIIFGKGK